MHTNESCRGGGTPRGSRKQGCSVYEDHKLSEPDKDVKRVLTREEARALIWHLAQRSPMHWTDFIRHFGRFMADAA